MKKILTFILIAFLITVIFNIRIPFGDEIIVDFKDKDLPVLNEELRNINKNIFDMQADISDLTESGTVKTSATDTADYLGSQVNGSIVSAGSGTYIQLANDSTSPGNSTYYGTNSTGSKGFFAFTAPGDSTRTLYVANDTFTAPTGLTTAYVTMIGGGGGGGGGQNTQSGGGGGAGGESIVSHIYSVTGGANYTVTVGGAGAGGAANTNGASGGDTSFDTLTVSGGSGGDAGDGGGASGGNGGSANSMDGSGTTAGSYYSFAGGDGANGKIQVLGGDGGGGAGSYFGVGGAGGAAEVDGSNASGYGSGGGGGGEDDQIGGNGTVGFVMIEY